MKHKLQVVMGETPHDTMVLLDGKPLKNVRKLEVKLDAGDPGATCVSLDLYCDAVIDGDLVELERVKYTLPGEPQ